MIETPRAENRTDDDRDPDDPDGCDDAFDLLTADRRLRALGQPKKHGRGALASTVADLRKVERDVMDPGRPPPVERQWAKVPSTLDALRAMNRAVLGPH